MAFVKIDAINQIKHQCIRWCCDHAVNFGIIPACTREFFINSFGNVTLYCGNKDSVIPGPWKFHRMWLGAATYFTVWEAKKYMILKWPIPEWHNKSAGNTQEFYCRDHNVGKWWGRLPEIQPFILLWVNVSVYEPAARFTKSLHCIPYVTLQKKCCFIARFDSFVCSIFDFATRKWSGSKRHLPATFVKQWHCC